MTLDDIRIYIENPSNIRLEGLHEHAKASERYVSVIFDYPEDNFQWQGWIPYYYRRAGLEINDPVELAALIKTGYRVCSKQLTMQWVKAERELWESQYAGKAVTKPFFD